MNPVKYEIIKRISSDIRDMLGDEFDHQTFLDTLDGETDAMDMVGQLVKQRIEAQETEKAMKEIAAIYTARARRFAAQVGAINKGLGRLIDATGETKIVHPIGTITRTKPRFSCVISDEAEIPSQLCKSIPDTAAIKKQLDAGESVPGAELRAGDAGVTVRVK